MNTLNLLYRENNYFNTEDYYIINNNLSKLYISKLKLAPNGCWYSVQGLKHKMTSIKCVNFLEIQNKDVSLLSQPDLRGRLSLDKVLSPGFLGVFWNQGKKEFLPYFWNNINNLRWK